MINNEDFAQRVGDSPFPMVSATGPAFTIQLDKTTDAPRTIHGVPVKIDDSLPPGTVGLLGGTAEQPEAVVMTNLSTEGVDLNALDEPTADPALAQYPAWQQEVRKAQAVEEAAIARQVAEDAKKEAEEEKHYGKLLKLALSVFGIEVDEPIENKVALPGGYEFSVRKQYTEQQKNGQFRFALHVMRPLPGADKERLYITRTIDAGWFSPNLPKPGTRARMAYAIDEIDAEYEARVERAQQQKEMQYALPAAATTGEALEARLRELIREEITAWSNGIQY